MHCYAAATRQSVVVGGFWCRGDCRQTAAVQVTPQACCKLHPVCWHPIMAAMSTLLASGANSAAPFAACATLTWKCHRLPAGRLQQLRLPIKLRLLAQCMLSMLSLMTVMACICFCPASHRPVIWLPAGSCMHSCPMQLLLHDSARARCTDWLPARQQSTRVLLLVDTARAPFHLSPIHTRCLDFRGVHRKYIVLRCQHNLRVAQFYCSSTRSKSTVKRSAADRC